MGISALLPEGEEIVYSDEDFIIVKHPADPGGYVYEVVPVDDQGKRLDDWEICPEPYSLKEALDLMEEYREKVRSYKLNTKERRSRKSLISL